jgi:predicted GH43/DUF377 family glycosyl hydrolase
MLYPKKEIVKRYEKNPILTAKDMPFTCSGIYNSGVVKLDGKYLMLCRVESIDISNYFIPAFSEDGYHFKVHKKPITLPKDEEFKRYTEEMIYDPRITEIDGVYYICFAAHSSYGVRIGMIKTGDFEKFDSCGFISEPDNRNGCSNAVHMVIGTGTKSALVRFQLKPRKVGLKFGMVCMLWQGINMSTILAQ